MIRFPCPSCGASLKSPEGTEGRTSRCKCGQTITVPGFVAIPTGSLAKESRKQFPASPLPVPPRAPPESPSPRSTPEATFELAAEEKQSHPLAGHGGNFALVSILLAFGAAVMIFVADNSPLIQANAYIVPAILLSIAAMAVAGYAASKKGLRANFSIGFVFGLVTLALSVGLTFAVRHRFSEIGRTFNRSSDADLDRRIEKAKRDLQGAMQVGETKQVADASITFQRVVRGKVPLTGGRNSSTSADEFLAIYLTIENKSATKILRFLGWGASSDSPIQEMRSKLFDDLGNEYDMQHFGYTSRPIGQALVHDIYPGKTETDVLVYKLPVEAAKHAHVFLDDSRVNGTGTIPLRIDFDKIEKR
jgi:hypothetical protein